jgi:hypothetical protein
MTHTLPRAIQRKTLHRFDLHVLERINEHIDGQRMGMAAFAVNYARNHLHDPLHEHVVNVGSIDHGNIALDGADRLAHPALLSDAYSAQASGEPIDVVIFFNRETGEYELVISFVNRMDAVAFQLCR